MHTAIWNPPCIQISLVIIYFRIFKIYVLRFDMTSNNKIHSHFIALRYSSF